MGTAEYNKEVQRRIIDELINQKNLDLADDLFSVRCCLAHLR